jgi:acetyl-CoA C-acetyltransferase
VNRAIVIVGVGEIVDRPGDPAQSLEPIALMAEALRRAETDAGAQLIAEIDSLDIVHQISWRYEKTARRLCDRLNIRPTRAVYGVTGGESPIRYLHEAALRIARGESEVAAVVGGEAQYAVNKAKALNIELPWTRLAKEVENPIAIEGRLNPLAIAHGAIRPIHVYPFYENASHASWNQTPREALAESGELWSRYSSVAAQNPYAWSRAALTPTQIITPSQENRLICYPYTKHMVANPAVNQGAAIILTSLERARALQLDESRLIYIWGGAAGNEPRDYLARDQYARSDAQEIVLNTVRGVIDENKMDLESLELYSCFPCVPKMTLRILGLPSGSTPTVTGGLSFFGAPLNNYMSHATCAMVRHLRDGRAENGMLYGQGEFITKHHALAIGRRAPRAPLAVKYDVQTQIDRRRGKVPVLLTDYRGKAVIETHTVVYDRDGAPVHGVIIAKTDGGERVVARVRSDDVSGIATLVDPERSPIGLTGTLSRGDDALLYWS